jgi:predicted RNA-binding Zn ribbon-like protein
MGDGPALRLANARLETPGDLLGLLEESGEVEAAVAGEVALRLADFGRLRDAIRELFEASIGGGPFPAAAVERLNEASERVPRVLRLDISARASVEESVAGGPTATLLADAARSAIGLLGGEERSRLRRCPACGRFFLAGRADRRWCSAACGNRTRVARHYARRRTTAEGAP